MFTKLMTSLKSYIRPYDTRLVLLLLTLVLFIIGAGAPGAGGIR